MNTTTFFCAPSVTGKFLNAFIVASVSAVALVSLFIGSLALASSLGLWS